MQIIDHWLDEANWQESPNQSGVIQPTLIVMHYTGDNSLEGALSWLCAPRSQVSAHLVISKEGEVFQLVAFNRKAWHAGNSSWQGRRWVNGFSIGIENVGFGDEWPEAQIQTLLDVVAAIKGNYPIEAVVGHEEVAPGRKVDPGPLFPWNLFR